MSTQGIKNLIGQAISDDSFRAELIKNTAETIKNSGFDISDNELNALNNLDFSCVTIKHFETSSHSVIPDE